MHGIKQSKTTPYKPQGNSKCKEFNWTLHYLLKILPSWPAHLNSLVFTYNAMPNSTTGLQPYQLMFGNKVQTPCHNYLHLNNSDSNELVSKSSWNHEHNKLMLAVNQHALKSIRKSAKQIALRTGAKELSIPDGNLVLLWDHPKGHNKIQDCFKRPRICHGRTTPWT